MLDNMILIENLECRDTKLEISPWYAVYSRINNGEIAKFIVTSEEKWIDGQQTQTYMICHHNKKVVITCTNFNFKVEATSEAFANYVLTIMTFVL